MSTVTSDVDSFITNFQNVFQKQKDRNRVESKLLTLLEVLQCELETSKENEKITRENLIKTLENDSVNLTTKYVELGEKFKKLEEENKKLEDDVENITFQMVAERESLTLEFAEKLKTQENHLQNEINRLTNDLRLAKNIQQRKEQELLNEIHLLQTTSEIKRDEIESHLKKQLVDVSNQLRHAQNANRDLQLQVNTLKNNQKRQIPPKPSNILYFDGITDTSNKNNETTTKSRSFVHDFDANIYETNNFDDVRVVQTTPSMVNSRQVHNYEHDPYLNDNVDKENARINHTMSDNENYLPDSEATISNRSKYVENALATADNDSVNADNDYYHEHKRNVEEINKNEHCNSKYQSLPLWISKKPAKNVVNYDSDRASVSTSIEDGNKGRHVAKIHRGKGFAKVPPLKPCSDAYPENKAKNPRRKRKLYHPDDDMKYLMRLEQD